MRFPEAEIFPWAMALGATGDPELARRMGVIAGREAKVTGFQQIFAPVLDVNNSAENPVINVRSFGEDPETVAKFGVAFIEGLQSQRILATAKHFPGHGDTGVDSHRALPIVERTRKELDEIELLPFRRAIDAGVGSIMIAHIGLPAIDSEPILPLNRPPTSPYVDVADAVEGRPGVIPATLSEKVQTGILRKDFGFKGLTVSDAMDMSGLTVYFTSEEAGVRALLAGTDILEKPLDPAKMIAGIRAAVASGRVPMARLDDAVTRQIAWKYELGLFRNKIASLDEIDRVVSNAGTRKLADEIATKAMTLVRNDAGLLPVDRSAKLTVLGISNGFDGPPTMAPFANELKNAGLKFSQGYVQENSLPPQMEGARKAVRDADVVIVGLYGRVRTGAANSAKIPENGAALVREALAANKKVIGISFGNPYILSSFPEMKTYLVAYGDMPSLQRAAGRSLVGAQDITGKLPITLPGLHPRGTGIQLKNADALVRGQPTGRE
jgi:beta-N-acetylhexosaminidase